MAIENGCHTLTAQNISDGTVVITTSHTSLGGEATCQTCKPANPPLIKQGRPVIKPLAVSAVDGNLTISTARLNAGERVCWLSDDA